MNPAHYESTFFVMRTPSFSQDGFRSWSDAPDTRELRERLRAFLIQPIAREALFLASPGLSRRLEEWFEDPHGEKGRALEAAATRYFLRMTGRATPFGLFAGCSVGRFAAVSSLKLEDISKATRRTRLDMDYVSGLVASLEADATLRRFLVYQTNTSLYRQGDLFRYAESRLHGRLRTYHLVTVEASDFLEELLDFARSGRRIEELVDLLLQQEVDPAEAESFVHELIDAEILTSDIAPAVTGEGPALQLVRRLETIPSAQRTSRVLRGVQEQLDDLDAFGAGAGADRYDAIAQELSRLPELESSSRQFQVDLFRSAPNLRLHHRVLGETLRGAQVLHRLFGGRETKANLNRFAQSFTERYGDRQVPLLEALDEDAGIGYGGSTAPNADVAPLLDGLAFPASSAPVTLHWDRAAGYLLQECMATLDRGDEEMVLDWKHLETVLPEPQQPLPDSFHASATVCASDAAAIDAGEFQVLLRGVSGPSGARLLGRFCYGDDDLRESVQDYLRREEKLHEDVIFPEIVHLPQGRAGNVLARPVLRSHELPYLGRSTVDPNAQIAVDDLMISVQNGRVVLRSRSLGKEVRPRLTSAHGTSEGALPIYRLLGSLQAQDCCVGLTWMWGALEDAPFLPRVRCGQVVLAPAQWHLTPDDVEALNTAREHKGDPFELVDAWRRRRRIPRLVLVSEEDQVLLLDLGNRLCVDLLLGFVKTQARVKIQESYPRYEDLCVEGPDGRYVHELIIPFTRRAEKPASKGPSLKLRPARPVVSSESTADVLPGSSWLYGKFYVPASRVDDVLVQNVAPLVESALGNGHADSWFFLRFTDPQWHLRVRLKGDPRVLHGELLPAMQHLATELKQRGVLWRFQIDTYERELGRYGGPVGMEISERLFSADSSAVAAMLSLLLQDGPVGDERWMLALLGCHSLLVDFGFEMAERANLMESLARGYQSEFGIRGPYKQQLRDRYRSERKTVTSLLNLDVDGRPLLEEGLAILNRRSRAWAADVAALRDAQRQGQLSRSLFSLVASHMHMHVIRMLDASPRAQELVLYEFLARHYASEVARGRARKSSFAEAG